MFRLRPSSNAFTPKFPGHHGFSDRLLATRTSVTEFNQLNHADQVLELVDGEVLEKSLGLESARIAFVLGRLLDAYVSPRKAGYLFPSDASFRCFAHAPDQIRKPDLSFIRAKQLEQGFPEGHCEIVPAWVCEVVSPNDPFEEIEARIHDFLRAGTEVAWVISPRHRSIHVYHSGSSTIHVFNSDDTISCPEVFGEFECHVSAVFEID